ncbi:hypothetical protein ACF0H5_021985 [Mactra antiquata]
MKSVALIALALACVLGLATAQFGYGTQASTGGFGNGGFLALIGLLFLLLVLFGNNTTDGDTTVIFGNFSGPTGGK